MIYLAFIMLGMANVLGSAWPAMHEQLGVLGASGGLVFMIISGATILAALCCDQLARRVGSGKLVGLGLALMAVALVGFSQTTNFISLCLWSVPLGMGMGFVDATLNSVVALHYQAKQMNWLHAFWGVGASIGPIIMSFFLVWQNSWAAGYQFIGLLQLAFVASFFLTFKLWQPIQNCATNPETAQPEALSMKQVLTISGVKQSLLLFLCYTAIEATVGLWASSYFVVVRQLSQETAALWVALYFGGITVGRFLAGFLSVKFSHKQLVNLGSALIGLGIMLLLLPVAQPFLLVALFLIGFGCAPIFPSLIHETPHNFGAHNAQAIIGMQMAFAYAGSMLMPPLFGLIATQINYTLFPVYLGGFWLLMIIMIKWLSKKLASRT